MAQIWQDFSFFGDKIQRSSPTVAISACLFGDAVRYDGNHKLLPTLNILRENLTLTTICPEVSSGMTIPRPPIKLIIKNNMIQAIGRDDRMLNPTSELEQFATQSFEKLKPELCGYIFKSKSPSCGFETTPIHDDENDTMNIGSGIQAYYFSKHACHLAFIDENQLTNKKDCMHYIFLCKVVSDIQQATRKKQLEALHYCYLKSLKSIEKSIEKKLQHIAEKNNGNDYLIVLKPLLVEK